MKPTDTAKCIHLPILVGKKDVATFKKKNQLIINKLEVKQKSYLMFLLKYNLVTKTYLRTGLFDLN